MNNKLKRFIDGVGDVLGFFLAHKTGAVITPVVLRTYLNDVFDPDDRTNVAGYCDVSVLKGAACSQDTALCEFILARVPKAGLEIGKDVAVVLDTGMGLVVVRATVEAKKEVSDAG